MIVNTHLIHLTTTMPHPLLTIGQIKFYFPCVQLFRIIDAKQTSTSFTHTHYQNTSRTEDLSACELIVFAHRHIKTLLTSSIIPLTFLCWQNTMSFKCLILSRSSILSDCSSLDLNRISNQSNPHIDTSHWSSSIVRECALRSDASKVADN